MRHVLSVLLALGMAGAAPAQTARGDPKSDAKEKMICKREVPIGSLIASRKRCMTKAQWDALERDSNEEARKMVYDNAGRPTGN